MRLRHPQAGVTLIEMMIVLVVIGVATGAATLGLGALARDDGAEEEARRLAAVLGLAVDEAIVTGQAGELVWDASGYQLGRGARHEMGGGVTLARADGLGDAVPLSPDATGAQVVFVLQSGAGVWHVALDGLMAQAGAAP
jgi:general secretion pathway protein H